MYNFDYVISLFKQLITGLPITLGFVIASWILGFSLSLLVTYGRLSSRRAIRYPLDIFVSFTRSVPIVLQLFLVYYGLPVLVEIVSGININGASKMMFCVVTFAVYYGSYLSEILRPAYLAVRPEQHDAAYGLGYTKFQTNIHVILPQMFSVALPSLGNEVINLVHQSSILFVLGTVDLMGQADMIISTDYTASPLLTYFCAGMIYWGLTIVLTIVIHFIEKRVDRFKGNELNRGGI